MKRALVYLLLGPASAVFAIWIEFGAPAEPPFGIIALLFLFLSLPSAVLALVDGCLARRFPILVRAPLTAIAGSALAFLALMPPPCEWNRFAVGSVLYMAACSLFAHDYGIWRLPRPKHGLPVNAG